MAYVQGQHTRKGSTGEIKVYVNLLTTDDPEISPLPYFDPGVPVTSPLPYFEETIYLYSNLNAGTYMDNGVKYLQYRYVLTPGGEAARINKSNQLEQLQ